ncbi:MAG: DUF1854 domain-containing protein [Burkholderiaceae bacterium]
MNGGSPDAHGGAVTLAFDAHGRLSLRRADGSVLDDVTAIRAFPLTAPDEGVSLVGRDGREVCWIETPAQLDPASRDVLATALAEREIMPRIERILSVSTFVTPSEWQLVTDRGEASLTLRAEEDIRRLGRRSLLIADRHGIQFRVDDIDRLDAGSRRLLDRFL